MQRTASGVAAQGVISSRALELAGPQSADGTGNPSGYVPCTYVAPVTGIYQVAFYGPAGPDANGNGGPTGDINLGSANDFSTAQGSSISAWDLTVRSGRRQRDRPDAAGSSPTRWPSSRLATDGRSSSSLYVTTDDGYRYRVDTNGLDPNGFIMFGSRTGFLDPDGSAARPRRDRQRRWRGDERPRRRHADRSRRSSRSPSRRSPRLTLAALGHPDDADAAGDLRPVLLGQHRGQQQHGLRWRHVPLHRERRRHLRDRRVRATGSTSTPATRATRSCSVSATAGANDVTWDGLDNSGAPFPAGSSYQFTLGVHAGEYHFPELDAESSTLGGPTFTLLNPPGGNCPFGRSSCTTAFYDDRGYTTSAGDARRYAGCPALRHEPADHEPLRPADRLRQLERPAGLRHRHRRQHQRLVHRCLRRRQGSGHLDLLPEQPDEQHAQHPDQRADAAPRRADDTRHRRLGLDA